MPSERQQAWYVKASFGAEWGPMSADTLLTMADSGSLARDDVVRCGVDDIWQPVQKVLERLRLRDQSTAESETADDTSSDETGSDDESLTLPDSHVAGDEPDQPPEATPPTRPRRGVLPGWSSYRNPAASRTQLTATPPRILTEMVLTDETVLPAAPIPPTDGVEIDESSSEPTAIQFEIDTHFELSTPNSQSSDAVASGGLEFLDQWKRQRKETLDRLLRIVAEREAAAARAAEVAKAAEEQAKKRVAKAPDAAPANDVQPTEPSTIESQTTKNSVASDGTPAPKPSAAKVWATEESWEQTLSRWKRSLPDWRFAVSLLLLPLAVWWFWPVSYGNVAATYRAMYQELRTRRDLPQDKTGMNEFVERSQAKLDELIPWLKKRASSKDPDTQLLLWLGRDCLRTMLKKPRMRNTKEEANFQKLMAQWDHAHNVTSPTITVDTKDSTVTFDDKPQSSSPIGFRGIAEAPDPSLSESTTETNSPAPDQTKDTRPGRD